MYNGLGYLNGVYYLLIIFRILGNFVGMVVQNSFGHYRIASKMNMFIYFYLICQGRLCYVL